VASGNVLSGFPEPSLAPPDPLDPSQPSANLIELEMDPINSHRCMIKFLELFKYLLRPSSIAAVSREIRNILLKTNIGLSTRLFFFKLLLHFRQPLASHSVP
jgi:hypothetical protein